MALRRLAKDRSSLTSSGCPALYSTDSRFELAHYPAFVEAGDDIRIIVAPLGGWPPGLPRHDYWLLDDRHVWVMSYAEDGSFLSAEEVDQPDEVAEHLRWRDIALAQSIPLHTYLATRAQARAS